MLGVRESYYYLENYYTKICSDNESPFYYKSRLEAIYEICKSLEIEDKRIDKFLKKLRENIKENGHECNKINFSLELEYLLIANLVGKDPRYEHIFRIAKHCQGLYVNNSDNINNFLNDLDSLKNFVPHDKLILTKNTTSEWHDTVSEEYKHLYDQDESTQTYKTPITNFKKPEYIVFVNKIGGLILGVIEISDILTKQDRIIWVFICYLLVIFSIIVLILLIGIIISQNIVLITEHIFAIPQTNGNNNFLLTFPTSGESIGAYLVVITTIGTFFVSLIKLGIVSWRKFASWFEFILAIQRLKHPKDGWKTKFKKE